MFNDEIKRYISIKLHNEDIVVPRVHNIYRGIYKYYVLLVVLNHQYSNLVHTTNVYS